MMTTFPWDLTALHDAPRTYPAAGFDEPGVTGLFFDGLPFQGRATRVFAWMGLPAPGSAPAPAMVLVHGGGGTAFAEWVRLWTERGYAAIAMDLNGQAPRGDYSNWQRHDWAGPLGISNGGQGGFDQLDWPVGDQWAFHAVAAVIRAHSLLRSDPRVDAARIGLTGISWGGYTTCLAAGVDQRFRFAVPVYGCGFLTEDSCWLPQFADMGAERAARWAAQWDPAVYLPHVTAPMLWVTGTNDFAYPLGSLQKSYRLPATPRTLCLRVNMPHGHHGPGENPAEIHAYANAHLCGGLPLAQLTAQGMDGRTQWVTFHSDVPVVRAELNYTADTGPWQARQWVTVTAHMEDGLASAAIPPEATAWYLNLLDARELVVSSECETW
ncbi:MAG: alpha/beta hydrolase family protein [Armatimonadota bacterium]